MSWIFIDADTTPNQLNMFWILSTLIRLQFLFPLIELQFYSWKYVLDIYQHGYVLDIYQHEYVSNFYQLDMSWVFISRNRTPNSIN
jgi:hypothetical protein